MINWLRRVFTKKHINEKRKTPTSNVSLGRGLPVINSTDYQEIYRCSDNCCFVPTKMIVTNREVDIYTVIYLADMDIVDREHIHLTHSCIECAAGKTIHFDEKYIRECVIPCGNVFKYGICGYASRNLESGVSVFVEGYEMENNK